jgi:bacterioferritin (cytochrome b1)
MCPGICANGGEISDFRTRRLRLGDDDSTTRRLIEAILKSEEEHADDLAGMLTKTAN